MMPVGSPKHREYDRNFRAWVKKRREGDDSDTYSDRFSLILCILRLLRANSPFE